jgi:NitT/TauT family transport system ATP-binding protein
MSGAGSPGGGGHPGARTGNGGGAGNHGAAGAPLSIRGLVKRFDDLPVLDGLDLDVPARGVTAVLGPSGCGKTTLLRILAGLVRADAGRIEGARPEQVTILFQEPRLLPWETVRANVEFVLPPHWEPGERAAAVAAVLADVQMAEFAGYYPAELSGGMAQRVALARAFVYPGELLLLDEPFQGLDLSLRLSLIGVFERLLASRPRTSLFVTHSVREALLVGEEIALLSARPARVVEMTGNDLPRGERRLDSEAFIRRERDLYRAISAE